MAKAQPLPQDKTSKGSGLGGLKAWAKKKPAEAGLAGAGVLGALYLLMKKKSSAASTASTAAATNTGIDPATGVPYATELAAAQQTSPYSTGDGSSSGYGGYGGSSGGTSGDPMSNFETWFAQNYPPGSQGAAAATAVPAPATSAAPAPATPVTSSTTAATDPGPIYSPPPPIAALSGAITNLSPSQAKQAVAGGASVASALAAETPAGAETSAQRHAQEVANKSLRAQLK